MQLEILQAVDYVKRHTAASTIGQQCMCNIAFLLAASLFLQQVQYANANAGHVDPFRSSNYKHHYSNFSGALLWNA